jgi:hypothetical protein
MQGNKNYHFGTPILDSLIFSIMLRVPNFQPVLPTTKKGCIGT